MAEPQQECLAIRVSWPSLSRSQMARAAQSLSPFLLSPLLAP